LVRSDVPKSPVATPPSHSAKRENTGWSSPSWWLI
jgi:hypothetical protein